MRLIRKICKFHDEAVARQRTRVIVDRQRRLTICQMTTNSPRSSCEGEGGSEAGTVRVGRVPSSGTVVSRVARGKKKRQHEKPLGKVA